MYQPNFCAECGARIERDEGRLLWTSGRFFCAACGKRFRRRRFFVPLVLGAVLLSVGFVAGRAGRTSPPPLVIKRGAMPVAASPIKSGSTTAPPQPADEAAANSGASDAPAAEAHYGADGTADERPTDPAEIVSICGARTKKGTPCSRRVRGTGRCWQHRGMPAMLPPSKLIVRE